MIRSCKSYIIALFCCFLFTGPVFSQDDAQEIFSKQQLEQMVAPIALYPDPLLAQILMASTYPLEIVSAARWVKENPNLKGDELQNALQSQTWDPSVKSLTAVPDVLNLLNVHLDETVKLGDAFLAQQKDVLNAIQDLREKAKAQNHLNTSKEQVVKVSNEAPSQASSAPASNTDMISIEPASADVVYVPMYDTSTIYGPWPYPDYAPYSYYEPGYIAAGILTFAAGVAVGNAIWGNFDWWRHDVNINVNRYNSFNHTNITDNPWHHHPEHREGVPYKDKLSQERFGSHQLKDAQSRDAFRDRAQQGRQELSKEGLGAANNKGQNLKQLDKNQLKNKPQHQVKKPQKQNPAHGA
ncbi:MAG: DUF3300 domain-containing protein, partial [Candidatus Berkiella sp.]